MMDFKTAREPVAPFAPLEKEPGNGEPFCVCEKGMKLAHVDGVLHPGYMIGDTYKVMQEKLDLPESDIVIATYPKCGTTWMQQVVLLMLAKGDKTLIGDIMLQAPWIERTYWKLGLEAVLDMKPFVGDRRVWKTHAVNYQLPWAPTSRAKKILVVRNPFDAAVSMFHHARDVPQFLYSGDWEHFLDMYCKGHVESGTFWDWYGGWYKHHQDPTSDTYWISFEEMKDDLPKVIRELGAFLNIELTDDIVTKVAEASGFDAMKEQFAEQDALKAANGNEREIKKNHIRKGESGAWKETFTDEQEEEFRALHLARCKELGLPLELFKRC
eukprot:TRINITY_DN1659_c0_g1_i1.p1 TRINITY_DN1659_c0_g1~~TRINITY_DN1659_c0_g1_i1.p1  ORF type:complete len:343 (+),score=145.94 TRINITY_DN1659_c0_g1_i1:52-1029(+)